MIEDHCRRPIRRRLPASLAFAVVAVSLLGTPTPALAQESTAVPTRVPPPSDRAGRSGSAAALENGPSSLHSSGWWLGSTGIALVLAICGAICLAARKYRPDQSTAFIRVVGRVSLSPRHSIFMVKAGQRVLLVGTGSQGAPSLLGELFDEDQAERTIDLAGGGSGMEVSESRALGSPGLRSAREVDVRLGDEE